MEEYHTRFYFFFVGPDNGPIPLDPKFGNFQVLVSNVKTGEQGEFIIEEETVEFEEVDFLSNDEESKLFPLYSEGQRFIYRPKDFS